MIPIDSLRKSEFKRILFSDENTRNLFFIKLRDLFGTWTNLRKEYNLYKSRLESFMVGRLSIPEQLFTQFLTHLNKHDQKFFLRQVTFKEKNWGQKKGGLITYKKHKEIFQKGRVLGGLKTWYHFDININLDKALCELIGAFIGDGFTNQYRTSYVFQITGDAKLDKVYYLKVLVPIIKKMSSSSNPIISVIDNTMRLTINSKELFLLFTKRFKFIPGKKVYSVKIPEEIINSGRVELLNACIRGIFDTDGTVFFDKRIAYKQPYVRIGLHMKSKGLIRQVQAQLNKQGINAKVTKNVELLQINGVASCSKFMEKVGFSNPRHLVKIRKIIR